MIVVPPRGMLLEKFVHSDWTKILVDLGAAVAQSIGHLVVDGVLEQVIYDVDRKSPVRPFQNRQARKCSTNLPVQPFARAVPHFYIRWQSLNIFYDLFVDKRHTKFDTMGHREFVGIHEKFVWECGSHLQELE